MKYFCWAAREMLVRYMSDNRKNFIGFQDEEYDSVMAQAMASTDDGEQTRRGTCWCRWPPPRHSIQSR